ncbi:MAG: helix-turn-helix domain-containing protein [Steroidobacteraceae bacterium]
MARCTPELIDQRAFDYYPRLSRLRNYCLNHLDGPISLGEAAAQASLERTYFSTYFHLKVGVCFGCWLTCQRINQARLLLRSSEVSITEVAAAVGYRSLSGFERAFRSTTGSTAAGYRQRARPTH